MKDHDELLFLAEKEKLEAEICRTWRLVMWLDIALLGTLTCWATLMFWLEPVLGFAVTAMLAWHVKISVRFTRRCRNTLGFWPWKG